MSEQNFSDDIRIDPDSLDCECLRQPTLMSDYSKLCADARQKMDKAKLKIDIVKAECISDIRNSPDEYGMEKFSEKGAESIVLTLEDMQQAHEEFHQARYEHDVLLGAVKAIEQRKSMLEKLVTLHGQSYFAGPSVPRELSKEWAKDKTRDTARSNVKAAMNKKRTTRKPRK